MKEPLKSNIIRFASILVIVTFCSSCAWHFTPSVDLSNVGAVNKVQQKLPFKAALLVPELIRKHTITANDLGLGQRYSISRNPNLWPVIETGVSTIKLFKSGLEKLFDEVVLADVDSNVDDCSLVFEIDHITSQKGFSPNFVFTIYLDYKLTVYSPNHSYRKTFLAKGEGKYKASIMFLLGVDVPSYILAFPTLASSLAIYNPFLDGSAYRYSYAVGSAQENAFDHLITQLTEDPNFLAFNESETLRREDICKLKTSPSFSDRQSLIPNNLLDAAEQGEIIFSINNDGEGIGFDIQLKISSQNPGTIITKEYTIGDMHPGQSKEIRIPISGSLALQDGWDELLIETKEKRGYDAPPVKLKIQTAQLEKPELSITSVEINDSNRGLAKGNGNGIPENEETIELLAFIKNSGRGPGRKVKLDLEKINSGIEIIQSSQEIGTVNIGKIVKGKVVIRIPRTFDEKQLKYYLKVADVREGVSKTEKEFVLNLGILRPVLAYKYKIKDSGVSGTSGNGNNQIENGEKVALIITPINNGTTKAKNVGLSIMLPSGISADRQKVSIGSLVQGGNGQAIEFLLSIPRTYDSTSINIPLNLTQSDFEALEEQLDLPVRLIRPKLKLAGFRLNGIQGHTTVGKNQEAELEIFIRNSGKLVSEGLTVTVDPNAQGVILKAKDRTIHYGTLQPGTETEPLRFPLFIQQSAEAGSLPVRITISQNDFPGEHEKLALNIQEGTVQEVIVKGEKLKSSRPYISPAANFPPKIIIDSPFEGDRLVESTVTLRFRVSDDEEIRKVDVLVNGINLPGRGIGGRKSELKDDHRKIRSIKDIVLIEGANTIQIIAYDNRNERAEENITVYYTKELGIGRTFAIVIGIANYKNNAITDLQYTENDAREFKNFLMSSAGGNVPEKQIKFLAGSQATADNILDAVGEWLPVAANRRNDRVILFFAGHGVKKRNRGYFIAHDTDPDRIVGTSVKMRDITDYLYDVEAKTVLFFSDACHSGAAFQQKLAARGDRMDGSFLINQFSGEGHITMVAAKSGQESIELPEYGHGLFTYYLLKGLKGEADKNGNGDKKVDILELYRYVYDQVTDDAKSRNFSQSPKMDSQVEGDIIMSIVQ